MRSARPRVLFLSGLQIHPPLSGGNLRSYALASALAPPRARGLRLLPGRPQARLPRTPSVLHAALAGRHRGVRRPRVVLFRGPVRQLRARSAAAVADRAACARPPRRRGVGALARRAARDALLVRRRGGGLPVRPSRVPGAVRAGQAARAEHAQPRAPHVRRPARLACAPPARGGAEGRDPRRLQERPRGRLLRGGRRLPGPLRRAAADRRAQRGGRAAVCRPFRAARADPARAGHPRRRDGPPVHGQQVGSEPRGVRVPACVRRVAGRAPLPPRDAHPGRRGRLRAAGDAARASPPPARWSRSSPTSRPPMWPSTRCGAGRERT